MGNPLIVQIVLGLLFVFFCVLTYFCTKTWRTLHVVALFLTFVMTFVLVVMACLTLKTHATWKRRYDSLQTQLTRRRRMVRSSLPGTWSRSITRSWRKAGRPASG